MIAAERRTYRALLQSQAEILDDLLELARRDEAQPFATDGSGGGIALRAELLERLDSIERELSREPERAGAGSAEASLLRRNRERAGELAEATARLLAAQAMRRDEAGEALVEVREGRRLLQSMSAGLDPRRGLDLRR